MSVSTWKREGPRSLLPKPLRVPQVFVEKGLSPRPSLSAQARKEGREYAETRKSSPAGKAIRAGTTEAWFLLKDCQHTRHLDAHLGAVLHKAGNFCPPHPPGVHTHLLQVDVVTPFPPQAADSRLAGTGLTIKIPKHHPVPSPPTTQNRVHELITSLQPSPSCVFEPS